MTPSLTASSPTMTSVGVSSISGGRRNRILSYTNQISLTLTTQASASSTISFTITLKNPTSSTISSSDFYIEGYDSSNVLKAQASPYASTTQSLSCNTGCQSCTNIYTYCDECISNYELVSNICIPLASSKTISFGNDYMGHSSSTLSLNIQWPDEIASSSEIRLSFSSNWNLSTVVPSLASSSPTMTYGGVTSISGRI